MNWISKLLTCVLAAAALCWAVACTSGSSLPFKLSLQRDYIIMVPPWAKNVNHDQARNAIEEWTKPQNLSLLGLPKFLFGKSGLKLNPQKGYSVNSYGAGGNAFVAPLSSKQADALRIYFSFDPKKRKRNTPYRELIVSRIQRYNVSPNSGGRHLVQPLGTGATTTVEWAADSVFEIANTSKLAVDQKRTSVVLYVVDTGIKPFFGTSSASKISSQFVNVKFRQGRIADGLGAVWPDPELDSGNIWSKQPGELLNLPLPPATFPLYTPTPTSTCLNPQEDPSGHGTKVASTAVGATVGLIGKMTKMDSSPLDIEVESIRIYSNSPNGDPTYTPPPPTSTQVVASGIFKAVDAHLARRSAAGGSNVPSVLLFTSRSASGFDAAVETALWWAWTKGMICVVSGGNEEGSTSLAAMHVPNAMWYSASGTFGSPQSTSPARWDWTKPGDASGTYWPNPSAGTPAEPVPMPNSRSLIIVGGSNLAYAANPNPNWGGTDDFRKTSAGGYDSSRGPDIDILAPSKLVRCAVAGQDTTTTATGTSLATGYVAGAALAYLACATDIDENTPTAFRNWLTPESGPGKGCKISTNPVAWSTGPYRRSMFGEGTVGAAYNSRVPTLYIRTQQTFP